MSLEPLNLPMLAGRVAIAATALSHALFATFIVGAALIGALTATAAYVTRQARYERLAHMIAFSLALTTATVSFLGVILVFFLNVFWPRFWHTLFRTMFWPFLLEAGLFLGEAVFAYAWYYLWAWAAVQPTGQSGGWRQRLHLSFVWLAAGFALAAMFMIDITASYMLTPAPPDQAWANIFNPTMIHLDIHRWFGNLAWAGFGLAGLCAIAFLRAKEPPDQALYCWGSRYFFLIGFAALLIMPISGYQYLLNVRYGQPQAFQTVMLGARSWLFDLVSLVYGLMILIGSLFIYRTVRSSLIQPASFNTFMPMSLGIIAIAAVVFALPYHIQHIPLASLVTSQEINPFGKMQPNKYYAIAALVMFGLANLVYFFRSFRATPQPDVAAGYPSLLILLTILSIVIYLSMGWVRETARASNGYLVYGQISFSDERPTYRDEQTP